jgi:hypothetical protein
MKLSLAGLWNRKPVRGRTAEVGWVLETNKAGFIWDGPRKLSLDHPGSKHAKALNYCPAVVDHEARLVEVPCPIDLNLRFSWPDKSKPPDLINAAGDQSTVRPKHLREMIALVSPKEWRHPNRPVLQVITPYLFIADEVVYMTQLPPFSHYRSTPWPGLLIGGRFPIHIWPRALMWAFEWHEPSKDLVLRRGEPWFYVRFETEDPSRPVRLVEAQMTPELKEYAAGASAVTNYVNRTFSLFNTARERRPEKLLVPKRRATAPAP